ncbi:FAD-binding domain-containing protein [Lentinula aciculospora]|uniref:FAD-binding domain-containing protein n=1 Tax=Lentinula aciculospora TaxID=153920 RepID=A0A9W9ATH9_9AGAR|nr:FAD-binding domain-containing protein [Lentinula aciculospora]
MRALLLLPLFASTFAPVLSSPQPVKRSVSDVCRQIASAVSSESDVHYPLELLYIKDVSHWASSSSAVAVCSVEPGSAADVGIILQILGNSSTPFGVKGGGHASNPSFSSTTGVQIAMYRFSEVVYDAASSTATIGAGLVWDDVYAALAPYDVNVVGGRVTGVGVAGFTLGGGYSWKTNQYGLTVDTITAYELVKPDGTVVNVTANSDSDLFFALKGGFNNFGIVTRFTLQTFPQTQVWGGLITYTEAQIPEVINATYTFASSVTDPKAAIITTANFVLGQPGISQLLFYDGPTPPDGIFDNFLAITHFTEDVSTRDFVSLVQSSPSNATAGTRAIFNSAPLLELTPTVLDAIINETVFWGARLSLESGSFISYDIEPFMSSIYTHSEYPSAYPPSRSTAYLPLNLYYAWALETADDSFHSAIKQSANQITAIALAEGQTGVDTAPLYPNYAIYDTPLDRLYGDNLAKMQSVKAIVDPNNVMALTGGFKI